jgi:hypothetical protein
MNRKDRELIASELVKVAKDLVVAKTLKDPWKERDVQASILKNAGDMIGETGIYEQGWWDPRYRRDISIKLDALGKYVRKVEKDILRMTDDIESTGWKTT